MTEYYFEATVNEEPVSIYVTRRNEIMVEQSEDGAITSDEIIEAVKADGFNCCFQTASKKEFAEGCNFDNIYIAKREIKDSSNNEVICEYSLATLRKNADNLAELLGE